MTDDERKGPWMSAEEFEATRPWLKADERKAEQAELDALIKETAARRGVDESDLRKAVAYWDENYPNVVPLFADDKTPGDDERKAEQAELDALIKETAARLGTEESIVAESIRDACDWFGAAWVMSAMRLGAPRTNTPSITPNPNEDAVLGDEEVPPSITDDHEPFAGGHGLTLEEAVWYPAKFKRDIRLEDCVPILEFLGRHEAKSKGVAVAPPVGAPADHQNPSENRALGDERATLPIAPMWTDERVEAAAQTFDDPADAQAFRDFMSRRGTIESPRAAATLAANPRRRPTTTEGALPALEFLRRYEAKGTAVAPPEWTREVAEHFEKSKADGKVKPTMSERRYTREEANEMWRKRREKNGEDQ